MSDEHPPLKNATAGGRPAAAEKDTAAGGVLTSNYSEVRAPLQDPAQPETVLAAARRYVAAGLSVLPIAGDGSKRPGPGRLLPKLPDPDTGELKPSWTPYQERSATAEELDSWFGPGGTEGIGLVMGKVSGNAEAIDFDMTHSPLQFDPWAELVEEQAPGLVARLVIDETPSGGRHAIYRCPAVTIPGNAKLALALPDPSRPAGKDNMPGALIETRGEGGQVVVAPTPAHYHPARKPYRLLCGDYAALPDVTAEERDLMIGAARALNRYIPPQALVTAPSHNGATPAGNRPGDAYNGRGRWDELLEPAGWKFVGKRGETWLLKRPGKDGPGISATLNHRGDGRLYVFSSNAWPFEPGRAYDLFGAFVLLHHGGDFAAATKELAAKGYGDPAMASKAPTGKTIRLVDQETGEVSDAPATVAAMLQAIEQNGGDPAPVYAAVDALAALSSAEWAKVKGQIKAALGKAIDLNDLQRAITDAKRRTQSEERRRDSTGLPVIVTTDRPLPDQTTDALAALKAVNGRKAALFVRGGELVQIVPDERGRPLIRSLLARDLTHHTARAAYFLKVTANGERHIPPPDVVIEDLLALGTWPFPALEAVVEVPTLRPDGTVIDRPGYDPATRLFYAPAPGLEVPPIPTHPTAADLRAAVDLLEEVIGDFPFADDASHAGACALLLTPMLRPAITGNVPAALIDAPTQGTGKSLIGDCAAIIASGRSAPMMSAPNNGEEWRKQITAALADGATFCLVDNVENKLWAPDLARVLTAQTWRDRVLGQTQMLDLPNRATWIVNGNNIRLGGDLPRRCYWIRIDAQMARPWQRDKAAFRHPDLPGWVTANRGRLVAALLTMARAWYGAGRPAAAVMELGSFENWCATVGGILAHAGITGFLGNLEVMYEQSDDDGPQWEVFFETWYTVLGGDALTVADLTRKILDDDTLRAGLPDFLASELPREERDTDGTLLKRGDPAPFNRKLGNALAKKIDTYHGPYALKQGATTRTKAKTWRIASSARGVAESRGVSSLANAGKIPTHLADIRDDIRCVGIIAGDGEKQTPRDSATPRAAELWEEGEV